MENLTITEIRERCDALELEMLKKGIVTPSVDFTVRARGAHVSLWSSYEKRAFDDGKEYLKNICGEDPFTKAAAFIAALPDPETEGERKFTRALADAIDIATEYSLPDEVVAPVREAQRVVNAVLLEGPK